MRGEDEDSFVAVFGLQGSPPHARGRLERIAVCDLADGITPACAGKTLSSSLF